MFHLILMVGVAFAGKNDACDHLKGENQRTCIQTNYPKIRKKVNKTCSDVPDKKKPACRVDNYKDHGIKWNATATDDKHKFTISPAAKIAATVTLTAAGAVMMNVPNRCPDNPNCKLSNQEQKAIATFGTVVAAVGPQVSTILSTSKTDLKKANDIVGVLNKTLQQVPVGLSNEAQVKLDVGVSVVQATISHFDQ